MSGILEKDCFKVSSIQKSMWLTQKMYPNSALFNVGGYCAFEEKIDENTVFNALKQVIREHEMLRTKFVEEDDELFQQVCPEQTGEMNIFGVSSENIQKIIYEEMGKKLDLECPYKFNIYACKNKTVIFIKMHHMLCDGYSISNLVNAFKSKMEDQGISTVVETTYKDYVSSEAAYRSEKKYSIDEAYWKKELEEDKNIAFENCRVATSSSKNLVERRSVCFKRKLFNEIEKKLQGYNSTIYHYAIANIYLMNRIYNNGDFYIGLPILNRSGKNKKVIGPYIKVMPIGIAEKNCTNFRDLLKNITSSVYNGYKHLKYPINEIGEKIGTNGLLYNVTFSYQRTHYPEKISNIPIKVKYINAREQQEDITFHLLENLDTDEDVEFCIDYNTELFSREMIDTMLKRYKELFSSMFQKVDLTLSSVEAMNAMDIKKKLKEYQKSTCDFPKDRCLYEYFEEQAKKSPDKIAVRFEDNKLTYKQLEEKTRKLAIYLQKAGIKNKTLVGVCMERSIELVIAIMGIYRSGGAYVPIDPEYPTDRIEYMLDDSGIDIIMTQEKFKYLIQNNRKTVCLDKSWDEVENVEETELVKYSCPSDWAYMIYTSGSTGKPKGVINNHRALVNRVIWMQKEMQLTADDVVLQKTPFSFDVSVWEFVWPLMLGATIVMAQPGGHRKPDYLAKIIQKEQVTTLHFVPSMLRIFIDNADEKLCGSLKRIICSGEELKADVMHDALEKFGCDLYNLYGPTEAAIDVSYWKCYDREGMKIVPIGKAIDNIQLYIVNNDGKLLPDGVAGELCISGVGLAEGYYKKKEMTDAKFVKNDINPNFCDRIYKTNDLARYNKRGEIEYLGRADFQVKINGLRIELGEIEYQLEQIVSIHQAKVIDVIDDRGNKSLVAYLEKEENVEELETKEIKKLLRNVLPIYMVPTKYVYMDELPLSPNGKLDRKSLPQVEEKDNNQIVLPANKEEEELLNLFKEVLEVDHIGVEDDFFEYGGTSLKGIQLVGKYKKIEIDELFKHSTVRDILRYIKRKNRKNYGCLNVLKESKNAKCSIVCVPYAGGVSSIYSDFAKQLPDDINVYAINLKGHSYAKDEELVDIEQMSMIAVADILRNVKGNIAVYGHCVGSALAYEITKKLIYSGIHVIKLFVAGTVPYYDSFVKRVAAKIATNHYYSNNNNTEKFITSIGGSFEDLNEEQKEKVFTWFRHDGRCALDYFEKMRFDDFKVDDITVLTGEDDPLTVNAEKDIEMWSNHAEKTNYFEIKNAKHYFIQDNVKDVADIVTKQLNQTMNILYASDNVA